MLGIKLKHSWVNHVDLNWKGELRIMATKWVYLFDELDQASVHAGGDWEKVRALLGGKGANLAEMTRIGLPVPPGFTVST